MWTVILHYGRGKQTIQTDLTAYEASELLRIVVFNNQDCVNVNVFLQNPVDPRDTPLNSLSI